MQSRRLLKTGQFQRKMVRRQLKLWNDDHHPQQMNPQLEQVASKFQLRLMSIAVVHFALPTNLRHQQEARGTTPPGYL